MQLDEARVSFINTWLMHQRSNLQMFQGCSQKVAPFYGLFSYTSWIIHWTIHSFSLEENNASFSQWCHTFDLLWPMKWEQKWHESLPSRRFKGCILFFPLPKHVSDCGCSSRLGPREKGCGAELCAGRSGFTRRMRYKYLLMSSRPWATGVICHGSVT